MKLSRSRFCLELFGVPYIPGNGRDGATGSFPFTSLPGESVSSSMPFSREFGELVVDGVPTSVASSVASLESCYSKIESKISIKIYLLRNFFAYKEFTVIHGAVNIVSNVGLGAIVCVPLLTTYCFKIKRLTGFLKDRKFPARIFAVNEKRKKTEHVKFHSVLAFNSHQTNCGTSRWRPR